MDSVASEYVYKNWPGEIIFTGFEIGWEIRTGLRLMKSDILNSPVKDVFRISIPMSDEDKNGRMSWERPLFSSEYMAQKTFSILSGVRLL